MSNRLRHTNEWIAPAAMPSIRHCKRIAITVTTHDPQADALGPGVRRDGYVAGLALATDDGRSHYLPIAHDAGGNMDPGLFWHWCRSELARFSGVIVGANLIDALDFLAEQNVCFSNAAAFHDVQVAACLLDETRAEFNLSALAIQYLGKWRTDPLLQDVAIGRGWKNHRDIRRNLWRLHAKNVGPSAEEDAADPLKLMDIFLPQMEAEGLMQVWDVERKLLPILLGMRRAGVRVDVDKAEQAHRTLVEQRSEALREVRRFAGPKAELMAPRSLAGALIDRGVKVPLSASGEPSITKGLLERHKNDPLAAAILRGRRLAYIADAVVGRYILTHAVKGRIHAEFNQLKTDGKGAISRFSATNPNLQGIVKPEDDEDDIGAIARSLMLPEDGEQWVRDDHCLTGDTRIITIDGVKTMAELAANPVPVLSSKDCLTVEFRPIVWTRSTGVRQVFKVTLADGSSVRCTDNHRWMGFYNEEIYTRDLKPGTKLAHVKDGFCGYPTWYIRSNRQYVPKHRLVAEYEYGPRPDGCDIDHIDHDRFNWARQNLRYLSVKDNRGEGASVWWNKANDEQRKQKAAQLLKGMKENRRSFAGPLNPSYGVKRPGQGGQPRLGSMVNCVVCDKEFYRKRNLLNKKYCSHACRGFGQKYKHDVEQIKAAQNHKVISVEADGFATVYDIEVANTHTFVLENGLISHNSQADYRFLAHYASGPGANDLRASYKRDPSTDYHKRCAEIMRIDPADKVKRKRVKTSNFLSIYGGGEGALAGSLGISIRDARGFLATYHDTFPFVRATSNRAQQAAEKEGFIRTVLGRRQRFPMFEPARLRSLDPESEMAKKFASYGPQREQEARDLYGENIVRYGTFKALNYACSGGVADLQKAALVKMYEAGIYRTLRFPLVLVHDETGHSANMADLAHAEAMREAKQIMETAVSIHVPIVAEREVGPSWGEVREINVE